MAEKEGPRGFSVLLQEFMGGELHGQLSADFHDVVSKSQDYALTMNAKAKARVTITLDLEILPNGVCNVSADVKTKIPKPKLPPSPMWVSKGGNLLPENPRQPGLFPRDVSAARNEPKDVGGERREAKEAK